MSIKTANEEALNRIQEGTAVWVDIRQARDVVPGMADHTVLHAGPPLGLQACGSVGISLLPGDRPIAELVQRDRDTGDCAAHMIARRKQAEGAVQILDPGFAVAAAHQHCHSPESNRSA